MRKLTTKGFYGGCYKKSELDIDDKKALEIESEAAHQTPINGSSFLKRICKHNIVKSLA
ncbi:hypothetical protein HPHPP16_1582 [Helicobacter pylori Hp P-16]|nr:hypothetical protein HPHPP16_1582 [Helicobacter pylori Hp P-16]